LREWGRERNCRLILARKQMGTGESGETGLETRAKRNRQTSLGLKKKGRKKKRR